MKDAASCLSMGLQLAGRIDTVRGWVGLWAVGRGQGVLQALCTGHRDWVGLSLHASGISHGQSLRNYC
jgi:hypothetical protein